MTAALSDNTRLLAIDLTSRGFGFAVLETPDRLIDWGTKDARAKVDERTLAQIVALIETYQPDILIVEDVEAKGSRRRARVRALVPEIARRALDLRVRTRRIARRQVRRAFAPHGAATKHRIAAAIAECFPELVPRLPPRRKPWMTEDARMAIFDAVAMGLTYLRSSLR